MVFVDLRVFRESLEKKDNLLSQPGASKVVAERHAFEVEEVPDAAGLHREPPGLLKGLEIGYEWL